MENIVQDIVGNILFIKTPEKESRNKKIKINKESKTYKYYEKLFNEKSYSLEEIKNIAIDKLVQKDIELFKLKEIIYLFQNNKSDLFFKEESNKSLNQDIYTHLINDGKIHINIPSKILETKYKENNFNSKI